jgi:hypothetical protein
LTVSKVDGEAPSDKVALADRVSVGQLVKGVVCVSLECVECASLWWTAWPCSSAIKEGIEGGKSFRSKTSLAPSHFGQFENSYNVKSALF